MYTKLKKVIWIIVFNLYKVLAHILASIYIFYFSYKGLFGDVKS